MKRTSVILSLLALLTVFTSFAQAAPVAKFTSIEGNVDVTSPGKAAVKANMGDPLNVGDIIRTKSKAKCEITFMEGSVLRLAENSRLRVTEFSQEKEKRNATIDLFRGKVQNIVKAASGQSKYEVHTPTAVCGVRGTQFYTYYQSGVSGAVVTEGTVYAYSSNKPGEVRMIGAGQAMVVTNANMPPSVRTATSKEVEQHQKDTKPAEKAKEEGKKDEEKKPEALAAKTEEGKKEEAKKEEKKTEAKAEEKPTQETSNTAGANTPAPEANKPTEEAPKIISASDSAAQNEQSAMVDMMGRAMNETSTASSSPPPQPTLAPTPVTTIPDVPIVPPIADAAPPVITVTANPDKFTNANSATFIFKTDEKAAIKFRVDDGGWVEDTEYDTEFIVNLQTLSEKAHTLIVEARDEAGNTATKEYSWATDYTAPTITLSGTPAALSNAKAANIGVAVADASAVTTTYKLDGVAIASSALTGLSEGSHTLVVMATDAAGNTATTQPYTWTTDYTAPTITLSGTPAAVTKANAANIGVAVTDASAVTTTTYKLDGAAITSTDLTALSEGPHTLLVTATDAAGNTGTKEYAWTTDYTAPTIILSGTPAALTNVKAANIGVAVADASAVTTTYQLDGVTIASPDLIALSEGPHTLLVTATDVAGNIGTKEYAWTTDYTAPTITLSGTPAAVTKANAANIGVTVADASSVATTTYKLDGAAIMSPDLTALVEGPHILLVTATDAAGNTGTKEYAWTTDYTAPTITLSGTPATLTNVKAANIGVAVADASAVTTAYQLDGVAITSAELTALSEGPHTLLVTATDAAGNQGSKDVSFTLDIYSLAGKFTGSLGNVSGTAAGDVVGVAGENWGGWNIAMTGSGNSTPNATWTIYAGGGNGDDGYWISISPGNTDSGAKTLSGTSQLSYLSKTRLGFGAGTVTGTYDDLGNYQLSDVGVGSYTQKPLTFMSYLSYACRYKTISSEAAYAQHIGDLWDILIGGTQSLWYDEADGTTIGVSKAGMPFRVMGAYEHDSASAADNLGNNIWYSTSGLNSYDYQNSANTTYDGGAYLGLMGGTETPSSVSNRRSLAGRLIALYIDPAGNAGYLKGSLTGGAYPDISMFGMDGLLAREQVKQAADVGVEASKLTDNKYWGYMNANVGGNFQDGSALIGSLAAKHDYTETFAIANWTTNVAQNWGIYGLSLYGRYETPKAVWEARMGGEGTFGAYPYTSTGTTYPILDGDWGYWLAGIANGAWEGGKMAGTVDGRFLTHAKLGTITGDLLGAYNTADNTWQAVSLGTWNGAELSHVSDVSSGLIAQTMHYTGSYSYADYGYYSYDYYTDNHYGSVSYRRADSTITSYDVNYNQDGSWTKTTYSYDVVAGYISTGTETGTLTAGTDLSFIATAEDANYVSASSNNYPYLYSDGNLTALLGGTDTLWTATQTAPAKITMMGTYSSASARPHMWGGDYGYGDGYGYGYANIASRNFKDDGGTTYDGGAYRGYLAGTEINKAMDARFVALYIDPAGNAGYLKGALAGNAYPEAGMFAMDGSAYPTQMASDLGIAPGDMISHSVESGYYSSYATGLAGAFDTGGKIVSDLSYYYGNGIQTMSFANYELNRAAPWGIYRLAMGGTYEAPVAWTSWMAKAGGMGNFGANNVANYYYGSYSYLDGGSYTYNYYTDNRSGSVAYMRPSPTGSYEITYNSDGSYTKIFYSYGEVPLSSGYIDYYPTGSTAGTGFPAAGLSSIRTAEDSANATFVSENKNSVHDPDEGYWLADITSGKAEGNKLTGTVNGRFITRTKMGNASVTAGALSGTGIAGDLLGTYNAADSTWQAVSLGNWSGTPLAFGGEGDSYSSFWQYRYPNYPDTPSDSLANGGQLTSQGSMQGLIGGTETLFGVFDATLGNYPAVSVAGIGSYSNYEKFPLFLAMFKGKDLIAATAANSNALLFSGVNLFDANGMPTSLAGNMGGLYWKKNPADEKYEIGVLSAGNGTTANLYPNPGSGYVQGETGANGMWELAPGTKLQAYSLFSGLSFTADPVISDTVIGISTPNVSAEITEKMTGGYWQLWNRYLKVMGIDDVSRLAVRSELTGGGYNKDVPPETGAGFSQVLNGGGRYYVTEIAGVDQTNKLFDATTASARIVADETNGGFTSIDGGLMKGSFDPVTATWRAVALMTGMETKAFLDKISSMNDAQKQAFYDATRIPAFTVGATDLRGQAAGIDMGGASDVGKGIVNAMFLAPSTGGRPQLWASGNVNGAYSTTPVAGSATVPLYGYQVGTGTTNGITANFNIQNWGATKWGASVTSGSVPANTTGFTYPNAATTGINFQGGAAGSISATTTTTGTFSGTAAGVVK